MCLYKTVIFHVTRILVSKIKKYMHTYSLNSIISFDKFNTFHFYELIAIHKNVLFRKAIKKTADLLKGATESQNLDKDPSSAHDHRTTREPSPKPSPRSQCRDPQSLPALKQMHRALQTAGPWAL